MQGQHLHGDLRVDIVGPLARRPRAGTDRTSPQQMQATARGKRRMAPGQDTVTHHRLVDLKARQLKN